MAQDGGKEQGGSLEKGVITNVSNFSIGFQFGFLQSFATFTSKYQKLWNFKRI